MEKYGMKGTLISLFPLFYTKAELFTELPDSLEKAASTAFFDLGPYGVVHCAKETKILVRSEEGIRLFDIPFKKKGGMYHCDGLSILEEYKIEYKEGPGRYCDGARWSLEDATSLAVIFEDGLVEFLSSNYFGYQCELYFANEKIRPVYQGIEVKIIRFNELDKDAPIHVFVRWFNYLTGRKHNLARIILDLMIEDAQKKKCLLFVEEDTDYKWTEYRIWD